MSPYAHWLRRRWVLLSPRERPSSSNQKNISPQARSGHGVEHPQEPMQAPSARSQGAGPLCTRVPISQTSVT